MKRLLTLLTLLGLAFTVNAQKAVFVKLPTYTKRLAYYKENNNTQKVLQLQQDVDSITTYIIGDFTKHFAYGPVYYFYDTMLEQLKEGQLNKVLINANGTPVAPDAIEAIGNKYIVVQYTLSDHDATQGMWRLLTYYPNMERLELSVRTRAAEDTYYSPIFKIGYRGSARELSKKLTKSLDPWN